MRQIFIKEVQIKPIKVTISHITKKQKIKKWTTSNVGKIMEQWNFYPITGEKVFWYGHLGNCFGHRMVKSSMHILPSLVTLLSVVVVERVSQWMHCKILIPWDPGVTRWGLGNHKLSHSNPAPTSIMLQFPSEDSSRCNTRADEWYVAPPLGSA